MIRCFTSPSLIVRARRVSIKICWPSAPTSKLRGGSVKDVCRAYGEILHVEGQFWRYCGTHREVIPAHELRLAVHEYDGAYFNTRAVQHPA